MAEDQQVGVVLSLYESCINVISCAFALINVNYLKDLIPNHVLEDIIFNFNPLDLESIENADFLSENGISTESLWKTHHSNRWKYVTIKCSSTQKTNVQCTWRSLYFQRHFHDLINSLARSRDNNFIKIFQDSTQELYKTHLGQLHCSTRFSRPNTKSLECMDGMIELCLKHLNQLRLYNATCRFLDRHRDVLIKFAGSIVHVEVHQLRDNGVESLLNFLPLLFAHKLTSFALFSCKVQSEDNLRILLTALSQSTPVKTGCSIEDGTDSVCGGESDKEALLSGDSGFKKKTEMLYEQSEVRIADSLNCHSISELDQCYLTGDLCNKEALSGLSKCRKGVTVTNESCCEDDLYDDIFSGNFNFDDERNATDTILNIAASSDNLRSQKREVEYCCLTELELFSCLMDPAALKVLSQALVNFCNLHTLKLVDTGSCSSFEMIDVIDSIRGLVMNASLRHLAIENSTIGDCHGIMFSEMLVGSCQKCCGRSTKGLRSLRLIANGLCKRTANCIARKLASCSNCEGRDYDAACCSTNKNIEPVDCSCFLAKSDLTPASETGSPGTSTSETGSPGTSTSEGIFSANDAAGKDHDGDGCSPFPKVVCDTKRTPMSNLDSSFDHVISDGIQFMYLQMVDMTCGGATAIAQSLLRNRSLHSLMLPSCGLDTDDIAAIFNCIAGCDKHKSNHAIKTLDVRENSYEASTDGSLFNLISRSRLVHLDISFCGLEVIPDEVISALSVNCTLEVLKVAGNRLGDKGGVAISNIFKSTEKKSMLMTLDLSYNRLTASSLIHLGRVLTTWPRTLREISVKGNLLDHSVEDVKTCLTMVFEVVIITEQFDHSMACVDYVSVM